MPCVSLRSQLNLRLFESLACHSVADDSSEGVTVGQFVGTEGQQERLVT